MFDCERFDVAPVTRRLELPEISVDPAKPVTLLVQYAGESNPAWDNWQFTHRAPVTKDIEPGTLEFRAAERTRRALELANTVLVGWDNVTDDGKPVEFSPAEALRFLTMLYTRLQDVWMRVLVYVYRIENFRDVPVPKTDAVELGKR